MCGRVLELATFIRDHKIPLAEGGTEDPSNIQGLCPPCNVKKTAAESLRGRQRAS
jgi:5-methylcytosine-specific restriction enzyme A